MAVAAMETTNDVGSSSVGWCCSKEDRGVVWVVVGGARLSARGWSSSDYAAAAAGRSGSEIETENKGA